MTRRDPGFDHYRAYMKLYGTLIAELAGDDAEVRKLMAGKDLGPLLMALRGRIEESPNFERLV